MKASIVPMLSDSAALRDCLLTELGEQDAKLVEEGFEQELLSVTQAAATEAGSVTDISGALGRPSGLRVRSLFLRCIFSGGRRAANDGGSASAPSKEAVTFRSHLGKNVKPGVPCRAPLLVDNAVRRLLKLMFRVEI
jgi:hypothetical protein